MQFKLNVRNPVHTLLGGTLLQTALGQITDQVLIPLAQNSNWILVDKIASGVDGAVLGTATVAVLYADKKPLKVLVSDKKALRNAAIAATAFLAGAWGGFEASQAITHETRGTTWEARPEYPSGLFNVTPKAISPKVG